LWRLWFAFTAQSISQSMLISVALLMIDELGNETKDTIKG
jgi:hypothetical protein